MGSLLKTYSEEKLKGKVYTPSFIVNKMLDEIGYDKKCINKPILDPACGDGRFLVEVVKRIIKYTNKDSLKRALENIYGWDIDPIAVEECKRNLNAIVEPFNISVNWNIFVKNSLQEIEKMNDLFTNSPPRFDFIIGNPPYIRIQHLDIIQRKYIQTNYSLCNKGSTDIYIAFFELCFNLLSKNGVGTLITPNTYLYTQTGEQLRIYVKTHNNIRKIINYKHIQLFKNATTYSAVTIFTNKKNSHLVYEELNDLNESRTKIIPYKEINKYSIFNFTIEKNEEQKGRKLKDICKIGVGITTLSDKSYIFSQIEPIDSKYCYIYTHHRGKVKIEQAILKPIIKGSTYKGDEGLPKEHILFPYEKQESGKYYIIPEDKLKKLYPLTYTYLLSIKEILDKRDNGKPNPVAWYAFGRHQSIDTAFGKKIIFSPISKCPNFILSELEECTLYSGYFIKYNGDYTKLLEQLNSKRMHEYILASSRDFRGGWKAYNKKVLEEFEVFI